MTTTTTGVSLGHNPSVEPLARFGIWLLPVSTALLALGTLSHQPDYATDFGAYADYVTTGRFLTSHLVASIAGAAIGVVGVLASLAYLVRGRSARGAAIGVAMTVAANVVLASIFGAAAFAQPAIGRAYQNGVGAVVEVNNDVYGAPLIATALAGLALYIAGAIVLGLAVRRRDSSLRLAGTAYAVLLPAYALAGFLFGPAQPVAGVLVTVAAVVMAVRLPRLVSSSP